MEKQGAEGISITGSWVPQTPVRPVMPKPAPICTDTQENKEEQANRVEVEREFSVGNMSGLDNLPFGDLLALANAASVAFAGKAYGGFRGPCLSQSTPWDTFRYMNLAQPNRSDSAVLGNGNAEDAQGKKRNICGNPGPELETGNTVSPRGGCELSLPAAASAAGELSNNTGNGSSQGIEQIKTPQKPRRRKHRPKVVSEAKPKKDPKPRAPKERAPKPADGQENQMPKRKYVRKKRVSKEPDLTPVETVVESSGAETLQPTNKLCRRALNFEDELPKNENTSNLNSKTQKEGYCDGENQSKSSSDAPGQGCCDGDLHEKLGDETDAMADQKKLDIASALKSLGNQESKECTSLPEGQAPSTPLPAKRKPSQQKRNPRPQKEPKENGRNARNAYFDTGFDAQFMAQLANSVCHAEERQGMQPTSKNLKSTDEIDSLGTNILGVQYSSLQEYEKMSWLYFPSMQQRKIIPSDQSSAMSSLSFSASKTNNIVGKGIEAQTDSSALNSNCCSFTFLPTMNSTMSGVQNLESNIGLDQKGTAKKKRSQGYVRFRDLASINKGLEGNPHLSYLSGQLPVECDSSPQTSIEALAYEKPSTLSKKRQTKRAKKAQLDEKPQNHYQFSASYAGISPDELWKQWFSINIDDISERLHLLDINSDSPNHQRTETALVPYKKKNQENALVPFRGDGMMVPFKGPLSPVRKPRPRPRVNLDDETSRVWNLLMGNINSEGIDGTDEEKAKWWEEERRVFQGRADSFIARMHLVQGDRRFTPWKGSVVDSVVGVFLTQNVSDHLSSSAFMSLAAQFPAHSICNKVPEEGTTMMLREPIIFLDSEESISTPPVYNQSIITMDSKQNNEEKEVVNSDDNSRSSSEIVSLTNESAGRVVDSLVKVSESCTDLNPKSSSIEVEKIDQTYLVEDHTATQDLLPSEDSVLTSQNSKDAVTPQNMERTGSCSESNSEGEDLRKSFQLSNGNGHSFMELLQMAGSSLLQGQGRHNIISGPVSKDENTCIKKKLHDNRRQNIEEQGDYKNSPGVPNMSPGNSSSQVTSNKGEYEVKSFNSSSGEVRSDENNEPSCSYKEDGNVMVCHQSETLQGPSSLHPNNQTQDKHKEELIDSAHKQTAMPDVTESTGTLDDPFDLQRLQDPDLKLQADSSSKELNQKNDNTSKAKGKKALKKDEFDWDSLRREAKGREGKKERTSRTMDSVDWEAVRTADVAEIAQTIKDRGMNNVLAGRIQDFLNRLVRQHGSIDLEWLRDIPPDKAKEYLLSFRGLGLKSVECVRLLTLHHLAFPVDTNVGRIAVRLGWVPLQPLPESLQLHLLELYPILESIQKYLWPRLCKLDQKTLYELHYQMITFGKVFCTKSKPNCNACPMRGECRHFASAFASARLGLPGPEEKSIVAANENRGPEDHNPCMAGKQGLLPLPQAEQLQGEQTPEVTRHSMSINKVTPCEPIIEEPASPEPENTQISEIDIEDTFFEDPEEIPTIRLNMDAFTTNLKKYMEQNMELQDADMSKALVALTAEAASIPTPKLKNVSQLRTEHQVYELPDSHPLLVGMDKREPDDPCSYLLAIWTPGETADSIQPPDRKCSSQENGELCDEKTCFSCSSIREARSQTVRGTLLIPCRTAMRGSFPLNGTYFQVNEVFADHDSSLSPIDVPRDWIWNLPRKTVYFGTSVPSIFKGLTTESIQHCFWRGYVCVRGFDKKSRAPRPLMARLHFPASKLARSRGNRTNAGDA